MAPGCSPTGAVVLEGDCQRLLAGKYQMECWQGIIRGSVGREESEGVLAGKCQRVLASGTIAGSDP